MKKIGERCWEYKGFTILNEKEYFVFTYRVYDDEGFVLDAFNTLKECKEYIDEITKK